ncbi:MAG: hypothetical protein QXV06_03620 [Ignisphaera sp.]
MLDDFEAITREVPLIVGINDISCGVKQLLEYVKRFSASYFVAGGRDSMLYYIFSVGVSHPYS